MKLFCALYIVIVMGLSLVPCCIKITETETNMSCCESSACSDEEKESEKGKCKTCSPFFTCCGTSSGFFIQNLSPLPAELTLVPVKLYAEHFEFELSEIVIKKWQPPKISATT